MPEKIMGTGAGAPVRERVITMKLLKRFKNIKIKVLLIHVMITLMYPVAKTAISSYNKLLIFTDTMTYMGLLLLIGGVFYALYLKGDFDVSGFFLKRSTQKEPKQSYYEYMEETIIKREEAFNYPLFLGLVYLAAAILIAYVIL